MKTPASEAQPAMMPAAGAGAGSDTGRDWVGGEEREWGRWNGRRIIFSGRSSGQSSGKGGQHNDMKQAQSTRSAPVWHARACTSWMHCGDRPGLQLFMHGALPCSVQQGPRPGPPPPQGATPPAVAVHAPALHDPARMLHADNPTTPNAWCGRLRQQPLTHPNAPALPNPSPLPGPRPHAGTPTPTPTTPATGRQAAPAAHP